MTIHPAPRGEAAQGELARSAFADQAAGTMCGDFLKMVMRNDTILGVCEMIGAELAIRPIWLRLMLAFLFFWHPQLVLIGYAGLAVMLLMAGACFDRWNKSCRA